MIIYTLLTEIKFVLSLIYVYYFFILLYLEISSFLFLVLRRKFQKARNWSRMKRLLTREKWGKYILLINFIVLIGHVGTGEERKNHL